MNKTMNKINDANAPIYTKPIYPITKQTIFKTEIIKFTKKSELVFLYKT